MVDTSQLGKKKEYTSKNIAITLLKNISFNRETF